MFFKATVTAKRAAQRMALDAVQANIMTADPDMRITYVNPAMMAMLEAAEADMVKELPRFSTKTLVGSNIDVFHKFPDHQRTMLASSNVRSAAASAEELAASTQEIARSMGKSQKAAEDVESQAAAVSSSTDSMATAAQAMNGIVGLIRSVASQITLLALNATIEPARAGDAGKGFAVVASEVKSLAIQAAKATEQITTEIDGLQAISANVASAIVGIRESVSAVRDRVQTRQPPVHDKKEVCPRRDSNPRPQD